MSEGAAETLEYVIGSEKELKELINTSEVLGILRGAVRAGAAGAALTDAYGNTLWSEASLLGDFKFEGPIALEGEAVGIIRVAGDKACQEQIKGIGILLQETISSILFNNLKRMLTTEAHTKIVNQSYDELVEINRKLAASEARYREIAENLDIKVKERTEELRHAQVQLIQQEKAASIGQLAAGIAHEINNPLGFIASNISTFGKYVERFRDMLGFYQSLVEAGGLSEAMNASRQKRRELKIDYVLSDIDELVKQSLDGAERVKKIVSDLKGFSHIDDSDTSPANINQEIDRTLSVLAHDIPQGTQITRNYGELPPFTCNPALLCQAFLNIFKNSIQSRNAGLKIEISTVLKENTIILVFSDNGPGIPLAIRDKIFDPFFTTKDVGQGMGLGLAVARDVINSCKGSITVGSQPDEGACFIISLPAARS